MKTIPKDDTRDVQFLPIRTDQDRQSDFDLMQAQETTLSCQWNDEHDDVWDLQ